MSYKTTRTAIIEAAFQVFSRKGYNAATTREIAAQAGVAEVTLFRHFNTKHDLLMEVASDRAVYNVEKLKILVEENIDAPPAETLCILIADRIQVLQEYKDLMRIGLVEAHHDSELLNVYEEQVLKPVAEVMERYLRIQIDRGYFRDVNVAVAARILIMLVFSQIYNFPVLAETPSTVHTSPEELTDLFLRGLEKIS